jgi:hypothetical protein
MWSVFPGDGSGTADEWKTIPLSAFKVKRLSNDLCRETNLQAVVCYLTIPRELALVDKSNRESVVEGKCSSS